MEPKLNIPAPLLVFLACLVFFLTFSCARNDIYEGVYVAESGSSNKCSNSQIELMEKGLAVWRLPDDEVSFRWNIKNNEIWLSSKSGGIIIGQIRDKTIEIALPGMDTTCYFRKVPLK